MPITLRPSAGTVVSVSAASPATYDAAGYAALTWTEVKGFATLGEVGNAREVQNFDSLTEGRIKYRGIVDPGEIDATMADLPADPGQVLLKAAYDAASGTAAETISVKMADTAGKITYAECLVASWRRTYGGANDVQMRNATMPIIAGTIIEV